MKNLLFGSCLAFILLLPAPGFAVARLGIEGGYSGATFSSNQTTSYSTRSGIMAGGILDLGFSSGFSLQPEVNYIQKGASASALGLSATEQFDYFEIPVYFKYTMDIPLIKPFLGVGPYYAFSLKTAQDGNSLTGYSSTDFGFSAIGGAELAFTPFTSLFAEFRYDLGLTNLDSSGATSLHTRDLVICAGLLIGF